jgi:hypothetical protein
MLNCRYENDSFKELGITLCCISLHGKIIYSRETAWTDGKSKKTLCRLDPNTIGNAQWKTIHITKRDQLIAPTRQSIMNLLEFKLHSYASVLHLPGRLRLAVPPVGFWDPEHYILQIPAEQLVDMDICPIIWLCHEGKEVLLFTLSIRQNLLAGRHHLGRESYISKWRNKIDRRNVLLIIDGVQLYLKVFVMDKGYSKGRHMMEILLRLDRYDGPKPQITGDPRSRQSELLSVRIEKALKNVSSPLSYRSILQILD